MGKEEKAKKKVVKSDAIETIKAMYYSGKVKPSLNKIVVELKNDPKNLELLLMACECLLRGKSYDDLSSYADAAIKLAPKNAGGYYYKGAAFQHVKGKEQEALKNFNEALTIDPDNTLYLLRKANTHFLLFTDYHLPIKFAEKHRFKSEESLFKIISLTGEKESPSYTNYLTAGDASMMLTKSMDAKMYYVKAVKVFDATDEAAQDKNIYKDIIKAQNACVKLLNKFTE